MYSETTHDIKVTVTPYYLEGQSNPKKKEFAWAYHVKLENIGTETVQLLSRYWKITDGRGFVREVRGDGVVGQQPLLRPGESHEYTSGAMLDTPSGIMGGTYQMTNVNTRENFDIAIPTFSLDSPEQLVRPN